ncbi:bifunctional folylpolyglutamate synthase/dihydrofolate synthase [Jeotgalibacillus sp. S-D1]|uniref:bifunctional folylpolyglutamate synthase/dihydrofolate synthase n=1 Tax=Jeotgalibacillus sp. S-D1 TaxID=2552189 RepID=UPI0010598298|nr:folylpolyglutamate synthase/dihydrofolate synthase family protein [Jeotgalibacillus sp. S-D1]TDL34404.1 bifunctional folylpolyglutamate synthase/dihydrofolate synthase [Jeotgalibacillus sp. S-D1]
MIQTYDDAIAWIHGRLRLGIKPGLARMEWMMNRLGHPQKKIKAVHVGGTNGKGSTVAYLRSIIQSSGKTTGTFTSPYFKTFNERIAINGKPVSDEDWLELTKRIEPLAAELEKLEIGGPTEFEVITAMMFLYFGEINPVDVVLVEVGLGGRFDSTNIIQPLCSVITSIGLDHVSILGSTYEKIAFEKAGIIKQNVPVVTNVKQEKANDVIQKTAAERSAPLFSYNRDFKAELLESEADGEHFIYRDNQVSIPVKMGMTGKHQVENASIAIFAASILSESLKMNITKETIISGIAAAYWPGRTDILSRTPFLMMDGAHNKEGIEALIDTINRKFPKQRVHFLFAAVGDKDLSKMIALLDKKAATISFATFDMPRAAAAEALVELSNHPSSRSVDALVWAEEALHSKSDDLYIMTGSLYFLSSISFEIKNLINTISKK